jgi:hypothetical protein
MLGPVFRLMAPLDPVWQGILWGIPVGLIALLIYRFASNQADITRTKNGIKANLLALRLFRDDLGVVLRTQGRIFRLVGRYLRLGLVPLAILFVPVVLLLVQIESRFAYRAMAVGEPMLLTVAVDDSLTPSATGASLAVPEGLRVETPAFRRDSEQRVMWRILPVEPGEHAMTIRIGDREVTRTVWAGDRRPETLVPSIYRTLDIRSLGSPGEAAIDAAAGITEISVAYEPREALVGGLTPASWAMFISSLVFGFALRRPLGVVF